MLMHTANNKVSCSLFHYSDGLSAVTVMLSYVKGSRDISTTRPNLVYHSHSR